MLHRLHQTADSLARAPEREEDARDEAPTERRRRAPAHPSELTAHDLQHAFGQQASERGDLRVDLVRARDEPVDRNDRRDRRKEGEERIERHTRGHEPYAVVLRFPPYAPKDVHPTPASQLSGP